MQGATFPHDQRIRLRLCPTKRSVRPVAQPRVSLHLHIRPAAPEQDEKAAGSSERCTVFSLGQQADSLPEIGSIETMPGQHSKARSGCFALLQQECNAAVAAGAAHETHISTVTEQQKASTLHHCTSAIAENSSEDRQSVCVQQEASPTAAEAPSAAAGSHGHALGDPASSMCDSGGLGPSEVAHEPHSMTAIADNQQFEPAMVESPMQSSAGLEASGSPPKLHACNQSMGASLASLKVLDMLMSSPECFSPKHMHRQPLCSYAQVTAALHAQAAAAAHLKGATAHEMSMEPMQLDKEEGNSALELALLAAGSSAPGCQRTPERQQELRPAAFPDQKPLLSGSAGAGHPSSQPADNAAGPQLLESLRLVQAEPVGTEISAVHVTAQLKVFEEGQQLPEESSVQVHLVVSLFMLSWHPACAWWCCATHLAYICCCGRVCLSA